MSPPGAEEQASNPDSRSSDPGHKPEASAGKGFWDWASILMPIAVVLVGWQLSGAIELGLKREAHEVAQAKEMRDLIAGLLKAKVKQEDAKSAALTLSAYGTVAVSPLLTVLTDYSDEVRLPAAEAALRALGRSHPDEVCKPVLHIVRNPGGAVPWTAYASAVRLAGNIACPRAKEALTRVRDRLKTADEQSLQHDFLNSANLDIKELQAEVEQSLQSLERAQ